MKYLWQGATLFVMLACPFAWAEGDREPRSPPVTRRAPMAAEARGAVPSAAVLAPPRTEHLSDAGGAIFSPFAASTLADVQQDTAKVAVPADDSDATIPILLMFGGLAILGYAVRRTLKAS